LADARPMAAISSGGRGQAMVSPICAPGLARRESSSEIGANLDLFDHQMWRDRRS